MSADFESELRDRLRGVALPPAPVRLVDRVTAASREPAPRNGWQLCRRTSFLMPVAAVLVIAALAISGVGGPSTSLQPPGDSSAEATTTTPRREPVTEPTAPTPGATAGQVVTCDDFPTDVEPLLDCTTAVNASLSELAPDHPPIAEIRFTHTCWSTGSDSVRGCAPQIVGVVAIRFVGQSDVVRFGVSRVKRTWRAIAIPRSQAADELGLTCTEVEPPALTCAAIRDAVLTRLGPNHPPVSRIGVSTICNGSQIPTCGRYNVVDVHFAEPRPFEIHMFIRDGPDGQVLVLEDSDPVQQSFGPDYAADPPLGAGPWVWHAELSDDRRTLSIEFFGEESASPEDPCLFAYEPWVGRDGDALLVKLDWVPGQRPPVVPSATPAPPGTVYACPSIGTPYVFHLALPEPFTGMSVRDLNGWLLDYTP